MEAWFQSTKQQPCFWKQCWSKNTWACAIDVGNLFRWPKKHNAAQKLPRSEAFLESEGLLVVKLGFLLWLTRKRWWRPELNLSHRVQKGTLFEHQPGKRKGQMSEEHTCLQKGWKLFAHDKFSCVCRWGTLFFFSKEFFSKRSTSWESPWQEQESWRIFTTMEGILSWESSRQKQQFYRSESSRQKQEFYRDQSSRLSPKFYRGNRHDKKKNFVSKIVSPKNKIFHNRRLGKSSRHTTHTLSWVTTQDLS